MLRALRHSFDRALAPVPGWLLLLGGMTLIALAVLVPGWLESRHLAWQLELVRAQARCLDEQQNDYQHFESALAADDPVLLERLAFYHLRLKPAGTDALAAPAAPHDTSFVGQSAGAAAPRAPSAEPPSPSIEEMLHRPMPEPGLDYPFYQPVQSRLVRISTGASRYALLAAGIACAVGGLLMGAPLPPKP